MSDCLIPPHELSSLESGRLADPFEKLGYHRTVDQGKTSGLVRIFNPSFRSVEIEHDGGVTPCINNSGTGCFEALLPNPQENLVYRVHANLYSGESVDYRDPYAFPPVLGDYDLHLFNRGLHYRLWEKLGANFIEHCGITGVHFAVWAPNAQGVAVIGDFNAWNNRSHMMRKSGVSGVWEIFAPNVHPHASYKFLIQTSNGESIEKMDPVARETELRPRTAGVITDPTPHVWKDQAWESTRHQVQSDSAPVCVYEVHPGSWKHRDNGNDFPTYVELAAELVPYVRDMGYTHLELMPIQEHPLDESWGYQVTGYYSPTRRYGTPEALKTFIETCHNAGIGVILDWVPAHFPSDLHGLDAFDGTQLYAHQDPRKGQHPEWGTRIFNYGRNEVSGFLIANALYWLEEFHADGLRVDAVASMLYLDYARRHGEWEPEADGSNVNRAAVEFLKHLNAVVAERCPNRLILAEESSSFPGVTHPLDKNGLGFQYKWNLGWMHDFLSYLAKDPLFRHYHQDLLTFEMSYAFSERFMLVLSHDEVVHGKGSLPNKMPGDFWQKFANVRTTFAYMYAHPGKKLHFMGLEFGQLSEWNVKGQLDWHLLESSGGEMHRGLQAMMRDLNHLYRNERALHELDSAYEGFQWIDFRDRDKNIISFLRRSKTNGKDSRREIVVCVFNFSAVQQHGYRIGGPSPGHYEEILNTDSETYGGGNVGNLGGRNAEPVPMHRFPHSLELSLPPLAALYMRLTPE